MVLCSEQGGMRMRKKGHSKEQILRALRQPESGTKGSDICREREISEAAFYIWKKKYSGLGLSEVRELRRRQAISEPFSM